MTPTNAMYWSAGSSAVQSIFGAFAAGGVADAQKKAALQSIETNKNNYLRRIVASSEQIQSINRELGSAMSARGLEAMKAEAKLRTAGASTGLSGTSIEEIADQSGYDQILDNQILISRARTTKAGVQRDLLVDYMNFKSQGQQITQSMPTGSGMLGALASGLSSGLGVYTNYLQAGGEDVIGNSISDLMSGYKTPETTQSSVINNSWLDSSYQQSRLPQQSFMNLIG